MLATDVFKLVIGQQDFQRGAVVGLLLLTPAIVTFAVDWFVQRKQTAMLGARAVPLRPKPSARFDVAMTAYCVLIAALMLAMIGMAVFASFASFWPYDLKPSLKHYTMGLVDAEVGDAFVNSLKLAAGHRAVRHRDRLRRRLHAREDARRGGAAADRPAPRDAADGGARPRSRARLHLLLQPAGQSAERPLSHADPDGALHRRALLYDRPPDRGDGAEGARRGVRGGLGFAEGAVLQDLLARHACRSAHPRWSTSRATSSSTR